MGRARNPARDKAYNLWAESDGKAQIKDIAATLGVPDSRVRKWKSEDKWEQKIKEQSKKERSEKPLRKKGAQPGNKNAVGNKGGGPVGNQKALKHGGYSSIYWDTLSDEEKKMLEEEQLDEEAQLIRQIDLFTIREIHLMKALKKYEDLEFAVDRKGKLRSGLAISSVSTYQTKRVFPEGEQGEKEKKRYEEIREQKISEGKISYCGQEQSVQTNTESTYSIIVRLQSELTKVQNAKNKAISTLAQIRANKTGSTKNAVADDWIAAIRGVKHDDK